MGQNVFQHVMSACGQVWEYDLRIKQGGSNSRTNCLQIGNATGMCAWASTVALWDSLYRRC